MPMNGIENLNLKEAIAAIIGHDAPERFGEPFLTLFREASAEKEGNNAAAYICTLFLSAFLEKFPTEKLHTFVRYAKEECELFSVDCRMYEELYSRIPGEELNRVILIDVHGNPCYRKCCKQEIFEAFDFYTNR